MEFHFDFVLSSSVAPNHDFWFRYEISPDENWILIGHKIHFFGLQAKQIAKFTFKLIPLSVGYHSLPKVFIELQDEPEPNQTTQNDNDGDEDDNIHTNDSSELFKIEVTNLETEKTRPKMFSCFSFNEEMTLVVLPKTSSFGFVPKAPL